MLRCIPRRTFTVESLENRITPTALGLELPTLSLLVSPTEHISLKLGVDLGRLSLRGSLGSSGQPLSLGVKLDLQVLQPSHGDNSDYQDKGLLTLNVDLAPPAPPRVPDAVPGTVMPPSILSMDPYAAVTPSLPPSLPVPAPSSIFEGGTWITNATTGFVATSLGKPMQGVETVFAPRLGEKVPEIVLRDSTPASNPRSVGNENLPRELTSLPTKQAETKAAVEESPRSEHLVDELFRLREGELLEDFGMTLTEQDTIAVADTLCEPIQAASDSAMAPWLVAILAGCVAGSAWLNRSEEKTLATVDADPSLITVS